MKNILQANTLLIGIFLLILTGCPAFTGTTKTKNTTVLKLNKSFSSDKMRSFFTIEVGDVIKIKVYDEPDLSGKFHVYPSCKISLDMLKFVKVCGRTPGQVSKEIAQRLHKGFFKSPPTVSVKVIEFNSKKVHVFGEVTKPGRFDFVAGLTILTAIANAGGFTNKAAKNQVNLIRKINGKPKTFQIQLGALGKSNISSLYLMPGDIIYVPESWL